MTNKPGWPPTLSHEEWLERGRKQLLDMAFRHADELTGKKELLQTPPAPDPDPTFTLEAQKQAYAELRAFLRADHDDDTGVVTISADEFAENPFVPAHPIAKEIKS